MYAGPTQTGEARLRDPPAIGQAVHGAGRGRMCIAPHFLAVEHLPAPNRSYAPAASPNMGPVIRGAGVACARESLLPDGIQLRGRRTGVRDADRTDPAQPERRAGAPTQPRQ